MGSQQEPEKAILFFAFLYTFEEIFSNARELLNKSFGTHLIDTGPKQWPYYEYYAKEMGTNLIRRFLLFDRLIDPKEIVDIKLQTNSIETRVFTIDNKRQINIDPGYITLAKIVLASTKNYSHRIYLRNGIYGEVTLFFKKGLYVGHEFTYPDYKEQDTAKFLIDSREILKKKIKT